MVENIKLICYLLLGLSLLWMVIRFILLEIRNHKNSKALVRTERATVYYKHEEQDYLPQGNSSSCVFYITFHTDFGEIVKCYMNYDHFYIIEQGAVGELTWQGERFLSFVPERKER